MRCIIAEKPSVARDIARVVGAAKKGKGYIEGNGYLITWAMGHLITLAMPESYGLSGYRESDLPILPTPFRLTIRQVRGEKGYQDDPVASRQLRAIKRCFDRADDLIVATDAGREGELIFRYIYSYLGCEKPYVRLWISSLTERAILDGLDHLRPGQQYDNLYESARARSEADWLVGINASRALSIAQRGAYSLGRVQTPTLAMVCQRFLQHRDFQRVPYWRIAIQADIDGLTLHLASRERFACKAQAEAALTARDAHGMLRVLSVVCRNTQTAPPRLYDLTTLQKEANRRYGFSAEKTLGIAQALYEKRLTTYPRTGSCYISEDVFEEIPRLLATLGYDYPSPNPHVVNAERVDDHHAILPTGERAEGLRAEEQTIYEMVVTRVLEAFAPASKEARICVECSDGAHHFEWRAQRVVSRGWRAVRNEMPEGENEGECLPALPTLEEGMEIPIRSLGLHEGCTKPKPLHTEASLLAAMEHAGREIDEESVREALVDCGLGTPATRANTIETLVLRGYVRREKRLLVPTEKGLEIYGITRGMRLANVEMTGNWELALAGIAEGRVQAENFNRRIRSYAAQICKELLAFPPMRTGEKPTYPCPRCKSQSVGIYPRVARCREAGCDFHVFRTICGVTLSPAHIAALLREGATPIIRGFVGKKGRPFNARVVLRADGTTAFAFTERKS